MRFCCVLLAFVFLFRLTYSQSSAASGVQFTLSMSTSGTNEITVTVAISDNPGIAGMSLKLYHDKAALTPKGFSAGFLLQGLQSGSAVSNIQQPGIDAAALEYVSAVWYNTSNIVSNGVLFSVKFTVKPGVPDVPAPVLVCGACDIVDQDGNIVPVNTQNGMVVIENFLTRININTLRRQGGSITGMVNFVLNNKSGTAAQTDIVIAIYDSAGKLAYCGAKESVTISPGENSISFLNIFVKNADSGAYTVKILYWNTIEQMIPLTNYAVFTF